MLLRSLSLSHPRGRTGNGHRSYCSRVIASPCLAWQHDDVTRLPAFPLTGFRKTPPSGFRHSAAENLKAVVAWVCRSRCLDPPGPVPLMPCGTAAKSPRLGAGPQRFTNCSLRSATPESRPIPVRRNCMLWDCKVTPVGCACQEGNTICCIASNDGLDAGLETSFPHERPEMGGCSSPNQPPWDEVCWTKAIDGNGKPALAC